MQLGKTRDEIKQTVKIGKTILSIKATVVVFETRNPGTEFISELFIMATCQSNDAAVVVHISF